MAKKFLQGIAIGATFVIPGISTGTIILLLGFYRSLLEDISRLNIRPYLLHLAGGIIGALAFVRIIGFLMNRAEDLLMAFFLGAMVLSAHVVLLHGENTRIAPVPLLWGAAGFVVAFFIFSEPSSTLTALPPGSLFHFFLGGAVASATMLLPGVSGSAALVMMNLYDDVTLAVNQWQWLNLAVFGAGCIVGLLVLARLLSALYRRYSNAITFLLAGLILGSTRALLPAAVTPGAVMAAAAGGLLIYCLGGRKKT